MKGTESNQSIKIIMRALKDFFFREVIDYSEGGGHTFVNFWFNFN